MIAVLYVVSAEAKSVATFYKTLQYRCYIFIVGIDYVIW